MKWKEILKEEKGKCGVLPPLNMKNPYLKDFEETKKGVCPKCKGEGCEHCDYKGYHDNISKKHCGCKECAKQDFEKGKKPDYLDFDKDGDKKESMVDALKD